MAPEQLEGKPVDARTDIFAFGSMMFEIATGKPAFSGASTAALVAAILAESRPVAAKMEPTLPRALDRIISACLARNPDDRCQHAADLLRELRWASDDVMEPARIGRAVPVLNHRPCARTQRNRRKRDEVEHDSVYRTVPLNPCRYAWIREPLHLSIYESGPLRPVYTASHRA
jgi:serine/threonine protein kinase